MVATEGLLLVYVNSPPLLDTGGVILNGAFSIDLLAMAKLTSQGMGSILFISISIPTLVATAATAPKGAVGINPP